jgi:hypothetical protein
LHSRAAEAWLHSRLVAARGRRLLMGLQQLCDVLCKTYRATADRTIKQLHNNNLVPKFAPNSSKMYKCGQSKQWPVKKLRATLRMQLHLVVQAV